MSWLADLIEKVEVQTRPDNVGYSSGTLHPMRNMDGLCSFVVEDREDPKLAGGIVVDDPATATSRGSGTLLESAVKGKMASA